MPRKAEFGENWWARRWIGVLESFGWASRLQRGRTYARAGRVLELAVGPGQVQARVQGSRRRPYRVRIDLAPLTAKQWEAVLDAMASRALFAARLLAGEMPQEIEEAFHQAGAPLFPGTARDLTASCTCPDWATPCKHVAAVHYRLGQEFDADPFLLFALRGRDREQVLAALRERRAPAAAAATGAAGATGAAAATGAAGASEAAPAAALPTDPAAFWTPGPGLSAVAVRMARPPEPGAILQSLGAPPWPGGRAVLECLGAYYQIISKQALALAKGD